MSASKSVQNNLVRAAFYFHCYFSAFLVAVILLIHPNQGAAFSSPFLLKSEMKQHHQRQRQQLFTNHRQPYPFSLSASSSSSSQTPDLVEPSDSESNFGRKNYWNEFYEEENEFSWYSPYEDMAPFFSELVPLPEDDDDANDNNNNSPPRILLPGIGNDSSMVNMYDDGYTDITAFDYADEGVECAKRFFGHRLQSSSNDDHRDHAHANNKGAGVKVLTADARELPFHDESFDAVLEKGTCDSIYLSGGSDKQLASQYLNMAVSELARVLSDGGIVFSVTAACADAVQAAFGAFPQDWEIIRDGSIYITESGYCSNNVDATIFVWKRKDRKR